MLRNSFIENYKSKSTKAKLFEREVALFHTDLNKIISHIKVIPKQTIAKYFMYTPQFANNSYRQTAALPTIMNCEL